MNPLKQPQATALKLLPGRHLIKTLVTLTLILFFSLIINSVQAQINAVQNGSWNDPTTWDVGVPTASDNVKIGGNLIVTIDAAGATCLALQIGDIDANGLPGGIKFSGSTGYLTVLGTITMGNFDFLSTGTIDMGGVGVTGTLECGSIVDSDPIGFSGIYINNSLYGTFIFNQTSTLPSALNAFNNLTVKSGVLTEGGSNLAIEGNLTIKDGATLALGARSAQRNSIGGILTLENNGTLKIAGTGTIPANYTTHFFGATSTVEYYGTDQTVTSLNSSQNYGNLIISGSGIKTVNNNIGIAGNLAVNAGVFGVSTFTADRVSAGGSLTVANGATLRIQGAGTLPANFSTHSIGATSTIEYSGTSAQNVIVLNSAQDYGNLNVMNQAKTLTGNIRVRGTLTFGGSSTNRLVIGNNTLTLDGAIGGTSVSAGRNFTGSASSNLVLNGAINRTLFFNTTTAGTTNALNNLTINHNGNIATLGNNLNVNNNITFTAGKLAISTATLTLKGGITNTVTGGISGSSTSNLNF